MMSLGTECPFCLASHEKELGLDWGRFMVDCLCTCILASIHSRLEILPCHPQAKKVL